MMLVLMLMVMVMGVIDYCITHSHATTTTNKVVQISGLCANGPSFGQRGAAAERTQGRHMWSGK